MSNNVRPFACHGGEKMIYDVRMGPMALMRGDVIYAAYQANPEAAAAHPHVISHDLRSQSWSQPVRIGQVAHFDHHFGPVIWFDRDGRLHALYNCHGKSGSHVVAAEPGAIASWKEGPPIAPSMSYPHVVALPGGRLLLYYRAFGHLGYWAYRLSDDGGFTWSAPRTIVDMDRDPEDGHDCWAGSYHSVRASGDGRSLHIAFVYLDEAKRLNPIYNRRFTSRRTVNRYHLYYLRLDVASGEVFTIDGERLETPVHRARAERCKVWDTGWRLTNMPAIWEDERGEPCFLLPVSGKSPWECVFYFVRRNGGRWEQIPVAETNSTWCGCVLRGAKDNDVGTSGGGKDGRRNLAAYVVSGKEYGERLDYGGGDLEEWLSRDGGSTWTRGRALDPEPGLFYNNPRLVERHTGEDVEDYVLFFGWQGPGSLVAAQSKRSTAPPRGKAFLWRDGQWL